MQWLGSLKVERNLEYLNKVSTHSRDEAPDLTDDTSLSSRERVKKSTSGRISTLLGKDETLLGEDHGGFCLNYNI